MNRTLRRIGTKIGLTLYVVWLLAVVVLIVTRLTSGPVPMVVGWTITAGTAVLFGVGLVRIVSRTPQYVAKVRGWLS